MARSCSIISLMASTFYSLFIIFFSFCPLIFGSTPHYASHFKPNGVVLPVSKDSATGLHVTNIKKRTPLLSVPFLVDLNGQFLWVNCEQHYLSSTYKAPVCHSTQCSRAGNHYCHKCASPARPGCHNNTCGIIAQNPLNGRHAISELAQDVLSIQSIQGSKTGPMVTIPQFIFACAPSFLLQGPLPQNVQGMAGLGHAPVSLPTQLASHFGFQQKFALCLPSLNKNKPNGAILFGNLPQNLVPGLELSNPGTSTPLTIGAQGEYYIQVKSIKINNKPVPTNPSILSTNKPTTISTTAPYTVLEHSIFQAVTQFFANELTGVDKVNQVAPFGVCFNSNKLTNSPTGPKVPSVDLVMQNQNTAWRILGANLMVQAKPGVSCLGFVDGGLNPRSPIVIGAYQLEDNLLQFDLAKSRLGFSSSLLSKGTSCANFNFTSNP